LEDDTRREAKEHSRGLQVRSLRQLVGWVRRPRRESQPYSPRGPRLSPITIRLKLTAVILVAALAPLAALGILAVLEQRRLVTRDATASLEALASVQKARLEAFANQSLDSFALASSPALLGTSLDAFLRTGGGAHQRFLNALLADFASRSHAVRGILAVAPDGTVVGSSDPERLGESLAGEEYVQRGLTEPNAGAVATDREGNRVGIVSGPITFDGRTIAGQRPVEWV
jgi:hypothetical protein